MGSDITVTKQEVRVRAKEITAYMKATVPWKETHGTFSEFMRTYNLWEYVFHQAEVEATAHKYNQHLHNLLHKN